MQETSQNKVSLIGNSGDVPVMLEEVATAKSLNDYFGLVFTEENTRIVPKLTKLFAGGQEDMLSDIKCTKEGIIEILTQVKTDKNPFIDCQHSKFLYEIRNVITNQ